MTRSEPSPARGLVGHPISRSAIGAAREVRAAAAAMWGVPSGLARDAAPHATGHRRSPVGRGDRARTEAPVVLVHGFAASSTAWFAVRRALRTDGRTVVSFDYPPWAASVDELADRLIETIDDVRATTGADRVHLVGHSLGGVIIALALTRETLAGHVDLVVTLGSPFSGSPWAGLLPLGPLVRALRPGSALLRRLATAPAPAGVRWLAFAASLDAIVPAHRAVPSNRGARSVVVDASGHSGMLVHPEVIARIVAETALPGEPEGLDAPLAA
jgi:pimeloyl-ACP methyl ester carboxylesterase